MTGVISDPASPSNPATRDGRKAETRAKIIAAAGVLFRRHGIDAVGVDAVMRAAGLTHGGFYGHFESKEALAAEVCAHELEASARRWAAIAAELPGEAALGRIVGNYLRPEAVAGGDGGCVLPVLGSELARRQGSSAEMTAIVADMAETLRACLPGGRREAALAAFATMVGAVMLARLSADAGFAESVLAAARAAILPATETP